MCAILSRLPISAALMGSMAFGIGFFTLAVGIPS